jgi:uncharacterized protein (TIGR00725 family)
LTDATTRTRASPSAPPRGTTRAKVVSVVGTGEAVPASREWSAAEQLGAWIASRGWVLVTGGRGGVMEAASRGAAAAGGLVVGILPRESTSEANAWVRFALPTGFGEGRNVLVVRAADVVVSVGGEYGTLSEIALALKMRKPVVTLFGRWSGLDDARSAQDVESAKALVLEQMRESA